jgi:cyclopropane fatty-acyl-phospholipid synthase-like methyltransferase
MSALPIIISIIFFLFIAWTHFLGAPWIPTSSSSVKKMLKIAKIKPGDIVYDLGSGDGRVLIESARHFGAKAVGIEIDPLRYIITKIKIHFLHLQDDVRIIWGNFFKHDLSDADIIIVYLSQDANMKLSEKLSRELKPGTRIVSHTFTFCCFEEIKTGEDSPIYLYKS